MYRIPTIIVNGVTLDTFEDEPIEVTSSVKQLTDIAKVFTDFSQTFNVPASPTNNKVFKHYYDFNLSNPLETRKKLKSRIQLDGVDFVYGYIRMEGAKVKYGKPVSYEITFFGNLVNLSTLFEEDTLRDLNFVAFTHVFNTSNVNVGRQFGLFNKSVIYPYISAYRRWFFSSDPAQNVDNDENLNIHFHDQKIQDFKPAIKYLDIINKIESKYNITFNGFIKDETKLDNLYLWLNKDDGEVIKGETAWQDITIEGNTTWTDNVPTRILGIFPNNDAEYIAQLINTSTDEVFQEISGSGVKTFELTGTTGINFRIRVKGIQNISFEVYKLELSVLETSATYNLQINIRISENMPELSVSEFISGIVKIFNLVITSEDGETFTFTPLKEWYEQGNIYDITPYTSFKELQVNRPEIHNEITFKFTESKTNFSEKFKSLFGYNWGDLTHKVLDDNGKQVEGSKYEIELPFQQTVYEKLTDSYGSESANGLVWASGTGLENHLFFAIQRFGEFVPSKINNKTGDNRLFLSFGSEIEEYTLTEIKDYTLYKKFYEDYISDMYSIYRKELEVVVKLSSNLITNLKMNDRLIIDNRRFIIEEKQTNVLTGLTKLKLLNDIF